MCDARWLSPRRYSFTNSHANRSRRSGVRRGPRHRFGGPGLGGETRRHATNCAHRDGAIENSPARETMDRHQACPLPKHTCDSDSRFRVSRAQRSASFAVRCRPRTAQYSSLVAVPDQRCSTSCCIACGTRNLNRPSGTGNHSGGPIPRPHYLARRYRLYAEPRPAPTCGLVSMNSSSVSLSTERVCSEPSQFGNVLAVNFSVKVCFSSSTV